MNRILAAIALTLVVSGCKTSKKAVATESSSVVSTTDTTKTVADKVATIITAADTTKTVSSIAAATTIDFIESGGTVSIDSVGRWTLGGVKSIAGNLKADTQRQSGVSQTQQQTTDHAEQANGIREDRADTSKLQAKEQPAMRWYEKTLIYTGIIAIIAIVTFLLVRWLRRHKYKL